MLDLLRLGDAADDVRGAEQPDRFFQGDPGVTHAAENARARLEGDFRKLAQNFPLQLLADEGEFGHFQRDRLQLLLFEILQNLRGALWSQNDKQRRQLLQLRHFGDFDGGDFQVHGVKA